MVGPGGEQRLHPELEQLPGGRGPLGVRRVREDLLDHEAAVAVGAVVGEGFGREIASGAQFQRVLHPRRPRGSGGPPAAGAALAQPPGRQPGSGGSAHRPAAPPLALSSSGPGAVPAACTRGAARAAPSLRPGIAAAAYYTAGPGGAVRAAGEGSGGAAEEGRGRGGRVPGAGATAQHLIPRRIKQITRPARSGGADTKTAAGPLEAQPGLGSILIAIPVPVPGSSPVPAAKLIAIPSPVPTPIFLPFPIRVPFPFPIPFPRRGTLG